MNKTKKNPNGLRKAPPYTKADLGAYTMFLADDPIDGEALPYKTFVITFKMPDGEHTPMTSVFLSLELDHTDPKIEKMLVESAADAVIYFLNTEQVALAPQRQKKVKAT